MKRFLLISLLVFCQACSTTQYLFQAAKGQLAICNRARSLEEVLKDERVDRRIRGLLAEIPNIKSYGEKMGLKPTSNYREYVQLEYPAVSYIVSACAELEFKPRLWSFPIVGTVPYLGWFAPSDAKEHAAQLKQEGWDVDVRGTRAYSTLGWFRDPVLSSMIPEGEEALGELASVVIHESVHATLYIKGQSHFNESLAEFIARETTPDYLKSVQGENSVQLKTYLDGEKRDREVVTRLRKTYEELHALYQSGVSAEEKRTKKNKILSTVKDELGWKRDLNNATIMQFKTYESGEKEFKALFERCGRSVSRFLKLIEVNEEKLFRKDQDEKLDEVLNKLIQLGHC